MDKAYLKEIKFIHEREVAFKNYLELNVLSEKAFALFNSVAKQTNIYIFSGVIRNYLLGFQENRDVDVVITNINSIGFKPGDLQDCQISKNSFGGYKIHIDNLTIDAWGIESTWGLVQKNMRFTPNSLIKTAFFNFSSIAYDYNYRRFVFGDDFCRFLKTRAMDVVFPENPNKTLCVLSTIYYAKKYSFSISYGLCKWIVSNYSLDMPFDEVQEKHFHYVVASEDTRKWFIDVLTMLMRKRIMKKSSSLYLDFVQKKVELLSL